MTALTRLGVLGWPVAHSRSPAMHNAALAAAGLKSWRYSLLPVPPELLEETVAALPGRGFRGVNVTIPHKESALRLAVEASPAARSIGAANTLLFDPGGGRSTAENTDAPGLIAALPVEARGASAIVLGAGGTARAAVWALADAGAREIFVWSRRAEQAQQLCRELGGTPLSADPLFGGGADLLINCTPAGMSGGAEQLKTLPLAADAVPTFRCVVDFVYRSDDTPLIAAARSHGIPCVDGLELLVRQGALAYALFTGLEAPMTLMRKAARSGGEGRS